MVKRLAKQRDIRFKNHADGSLTIELTEKGRKRALRYHADDLTISTPPRWDRVWRVLVFDIPEQHKQARETFRFHLKKLGFYPLQRSVFILPYPCRDKIDFLSELYGVMCISFMYPILRRQSG